MAVRRNRDGTRGQGARSHRLQVSGGETKKRIASGGFGARSTKPTANAMAISAQQLPQTTLIVRASLSSLGQLALRRNLSAPQSHLQFRYGESPRPRFAGAGLSAGNVAIEHG